MPKRKAPAGHDGATGRGFLFSSDSGRLCEVLRRVIGSDNVGFGPSWQPFISSADGMKDEAGNCPWSIRAFLTGQEP